MMKMSISRVWVVVDKNRLVRWTQLGLGEILTQNKFQNVFPKKSVRSGNSSKYVENEYKSSLGGLIKTRTGNRYQARSNFDVTSFRHQLISSSFSFSRSKSRRNQFSKWYGDQPTDQRTNGPTDKRTNGPTDQRTNGPTDQPMDQHSLL
jgi:hypothetical protein